MRFENKPIEKYLEIKIDSLPYECTLDGRYYYFFQENVYDGILRSTLYDRFYDEENNGLGRILGKASERFVLDFPINWQYIENDNGRRNHEFPLYDLVARSPEGENEITVDNLNSSIFISIEDPRGLIKLEGKRPIIMTTQMFPQYPNHAVAFDELAFNTQVITVKGVL